MGWEMVTAICSGIRAVGSTDIQKVIKAFEEGSKFETLAGSGSFSQWKPDREFSHFYNGLVIVSQVKNGKLVNVRSYGSPTIED